MNRMKNYNYCKSVILLVFCLSCMFNLLAYFTYVASREQIQMELQSQSGKLLSDDSKSAKDNTLSQHGLHFQNLFVTISNDTKSEKKVRLSAKQFLKSRMPEVLSRKLQEEESTNLAQTFQNDMTKPIINPHNFSYVINQPNMCKGNNSKVDIVITVCTAIGHFEARKAIRETWGKFVHFEGSGIKILFFLGVQNDETIQKKVIQENETYQDIVQENFIDSYRNLSVKSVGVLKWIKDYCETTKFVLKVDDDIFVNIPNLVEVLAEITYPRIILGYLFVGARPIQDKESKWYTPKKDFPHEVYPPYVSGTSYILSQESVRDLYFVSLYTKLFWLEDIYITGICAERAKIKLIHHPEISFTTREPNGCAFKNAITGHEVTISEMYTIHTQLSNPNLKCDDEPQIPT